MIRVLILTTFFLVPICVANARCPELAKMFANNPNSMELNDLGSLKKCVSDTLRERLHSGSTPAVSASENNSSSTSAVKAARDNIDRKSAVSIEKAPNKPVPLAH